ncbi:hypothetical protein [Microbispora siamensis]|uniref:Uncharacterized protein n=1 Tax=Microbispora siamensis TaxID=564413 RepID=A0ABQ4GRI9_9ACTN|nr:hypothetical protein [Microbispora siamensis]GIH63993.1 hypothetical protein Msi02_48100 [Microbispora siamensis]
MADDGRFNIGLIYDVTKVLEQHGYRLPEGEGRTSALGAFAGVLLHLVDTYEGRRDVLGDKVA